MLMHNTAIYVPINAGEAHNVTQRFLQPDWSLSNITLAFTSGASGQTAVLDGLVTFHEPPLNVGYLGLFATEKCFVQVGANPTAASASPLMLLKDAPMFIITVFTGQKIAARGVSASGTLYAMPLR